MTKQDAPPVANVLSARKEFTASERAILESRYRAVVSKLGMKAAARHDHRQMERGAATMLLHGAGIVEAEGIENTTACPACIEQFGLVEGVEAVAALNREIEQLQREDKIAREGIVSIEVPEGVEILMDRADLDARIAYLRRHGRGHVSDELRRLVSEQAGRDLEKVL